jgi:general stress protein 26
MDESIRQEIQALVQSSKNIFVSSVNQEGYPCTKAMFALDRDGMNVFYFSTNLSARRTSQFQINSKASIYFCDEAKYQGLQLTGEMQVCTDRELKTRLWKDGFEMYYPNGVDDEDYCVLKFTAKTGTYYPKHREVFSVEEL